jgi:2-oxoglutarate/2-oxoacid ferredoxin oxidoreductase subunit alpha
VIWDVTRMGPSTGMPTRTSQGDLLFTYFLGHGDTHQICLLPADMEEIFEFGWRSFDIAEQIQTPVFVLSDLDLGMNHWMADPFKYPDEPIQRGKVLNKEKLQAFIEEHGKWGRYMDVDGDGVTYRTLPGTDHPMAAYFTRGTGHDEMAIYSERSDVWLENLTRIHTKIMKTALQVLPEPIVDLTGEAKVGIITFGSNEAAILEARDKMAAQGLATDYLRVRAVPLHQQVSEFLHNYQSVYVIENNFDGQLYQIICSEHPEDITHVKSLPLGDGLPMTAEWVIEQITESEGQ